MKRRSVVWFFAVFACLVPLAGCGFRPAYQAETAEKLAQVSFAPMADRQGHILRSALVRAFDPQGLDLSPEYEFSGNWTANVENLLSEDSDIRSARGTLTLSGTLQDTKGHTLWSGQVSRSALFVQHVLPSLSADAQDRLWQDLSAQLAQDLVWAISDILE